MVRSQNNLFAIAQSFLGGNKMSNDETETVRDQAIDLADECNNHRDMLRNCLQWMDHAAIALMLEANGWVTYNDD